MTWFRAWRSPSLARSRYSVMRGDESDIAPILSACSNRCCMAVERFENLLRIAILRQIGKRSIQHQPGFRIHFVRPLAISEVRLARITAKVAQREISRSNLAQDNGIVTGGFTDAVEIRGGLR